MRDRTETRRHRGVYKHPRDPGKYCIEYYDQYGKRHRELVGTLKQAEAAYRARRTDVARGIYEPRLQESKKPRRIVLRDVIQDYLELHSKRLKSWDHEQRHGKFWQKYLDRKLIDQVTNADLERFISDWLEGKTVGRLRARKHKPGSVNRKLTFLKAVYNWAIRNKLARENPVKLVKMLKENNARVRFLTPDEQKRLANKLGPTWWPWVAFAIGTGLRQGEQLALRWEDIQFRNRMIHVRDSKSGEGRYVPMTEDVAEVLMALPSYQTCEWVFPNAAGDGPMSRHGQFRREFEDALRGAKITNFRWHDLRHTCASALAVAGVPLNTIREILGHKTMAMTMRYAHLCPAHLANAMAKIKVFKPRS